MRTVDYSEILHGSAALAGMRPENLGPEDFALFRTFHDRRLQKGWELLKHPDLCPIERRFYRQAWSSATAYTAAQERYHIESGRYFQALRASTNEPPMTADVENSDYWAGCKSSYGAADWVTGMAYIAGDQVRDPLTDLQYQVHTAHTAGATIDLTKMGVLTPFLKYIAYEQTGETAIGEYLCATDRDPRVTTRTVKYAGMLTQEGLTLPQTAPASVWLYFRLRRPVLLGDAWDSETIYASGRQVYFAATSGGAGNLYTANATTAAAESPGTTPGKWDLVDIPYFLRGYLIEGGFADWLTGDGQTDKALAHEDMATDFLEQEADKLQRQQQQVGRFQLA